MKNISLRDIQQLTNVEVLNMELFKQRRVSGISTDSRNVVNNDIFFALRGETFDGHDFLDNVMLRDVTAIVVRQEWSKKNYERIRLFPCACIVVPDTIIALGELGRIYRRKFDLPIIAIAGSNGKTTTKEMITAVLRTKYTVLSTEGNLNNHIGVPMTLFRLAAEHDVAVVEFGTNHFGEIQYLCNLAEPTDGVITNIGKEHLEFFGDEHGVAKEEKELFRFLENRNGYAFVNVDDPVLRDEKNQLKKYLSYGTTSTADIRAQDVHINELGETIFYSLWQRKNISFQVKLAVPGIHNVSNALAAISIGLKCKVNTKKIVKALQNFSSASNRMEVLSHNGIIVLNDTYNSNPDSVLAALKTLQTFNAKGKKVAVLGDMRELGEASKREHAHVGVLAAELKVDALYTHGLFSQYTNEAFGLPTGKHYDTKELLVADLKNVIRPGDVVLIKGSRGMKMEDVVAQLLTTNNTETAKD